MAAADHYATLDDVNALAPQVPYTDTSKPNAALVTKLIESVATRMDASLSNIGYVTPVVSGDKALALLREACAWGTMGLAQQIRDSGITTAVSAGASERKNIWLKMFDDWNARLCDPNDPFELPDAPRTDEQLLKQGESLLRSSVQGVTDDPNFSPTTPVVTRYQTL